MKDVRRNVDCEKIAKFECPLMAHSGRPRIVFPDVERAMRGGRYSYADNGEARTYSAVTLFC